MINAFSHFSRIFFPIILIIMLVLYSAFLNEKELALDDLIAPLQKGVSYASSTIDGRLEKLKSELLFVAQLPAMSEYAQTGDAAQLEPLKLVLVGLIEGSGVFNNVYLRDQSGKEILRVERDGGHARVTDPARLNVAPALDDIDTFASSPSGEVRLAVVVSANALGEHSERLLRFSAPIGVAPGTRLFLSADVEGGKLMHPMVKHGDLIGAEILIFNNEGALFYSTDKRQAVVDPPLTGKYSDDALDALRINPAKQHFSWRQGELWVYESFTTPVLAAWRIAALVSKYAVEEKLAVLRLRYQWLALFGFFLAAAISLVYVRATLRAEWFSKENEKFVEQISEASRLLNLFITNVPAAVAMVDREMRYIAVSNRWLEEFRLVEDVIGQSHFDAFPLAPPYWKSVYQRCLEGAVEHCDEERLTHLDGSAEWVRWEVRPWYTAKNEIGGLMVLMEVITSRKQASVVRDEFVAKLSHELRTPLTAIMGGMKLLQANVFGKLEPQAAEILNIAERNSQRLLNLVNDLLDMQKLRIGEMTFHLENITIKNAVDEAVRHVAALAKERHIEVVINDASYGAKVCVDDKRLTQVIVNLLLNAIKHSPESGRVTIEVARSYREVMVSIADSGPGVPESLTRQVFNDFAQEDESDTRKPGGTGLGLPIARSLIEKFGGNMSFYNQEQSGAVFYFSLPEASTLE